MFDVFYSGIKPNLFAHEQAVESIEQAQQLSRTRFFWFVNYLSDYTDFDFLWEPVPWQAHQRHAWPSQHQPDSGTYLVPKVGYTDTNYHSDRYIHRLPTLEYWHIPDWIDSASIDRRWSPDPMEPPYIYEFPVEWGWDNVCGPEYRVPGAVERKFVHDFVARTNRDSAAWYQHYDVELSEELARWRPCPMDPPYIYVFGNQWYPAEIMPTVEYRVPGATDKKHMTELKANLPERHSNHWHTIEDCEWDYSWVPDPGDPPYIYVFGNQWHSAEIMPTVTYTAPGATERKYMDYPRARLLESTANWDNLSEHRYTFDYSWVPDPGDPPMVYVFGNQHWPSEKMPVLRYYGDNIDESSPIKYMDYPRAELLPNKTLWQLPKGVKEEQVDFTWVPDPGEPPYIYQFATQHQKTGGPVYHVPGATETKYLEHVEIKIETTTVPVVEIDHMDGNAGGIPDTVKRIRYFDNYRDTLIRLAKSLLGEHEFVWVCSSICDYTDFDFSWHPEKWQSTMLHVFASDEQKFGDTFYMHVPTFAARAEKKQLLEWYSVNYVRGKSVPRRPMPVICHDKDTHVDAVIDCDFAGPLALFTTDTATSVPTVAVSLWRAETKSITPITKGATSVVIPKIAIPFIQTQLYDYPNIDKSKMTRPGKLHDVIFISNGESMADENWSHLRSICTRAKRSDGVTGREKAYKAAANMSETPWFFAVFAKTEVLPDFTFDYQADLMQQPKHYIFHSRNPLNGLEYGAMNINLYNRHLVLTTNPGIDFTLSAAHDVVPICASISRFNTDPWVTWRSAFREVLKLKQEVDLGADVEIQYRLKVWTTTAAGENADWCLRGSDDALEYYASVAGDNNKLMLSFDWAWLQEYYYSKYQARPWLELV